MRTSKIRFRTLKGLLPQSCHIENARNKTASMLYCMKSSTRVEGPWRNLCASDYLELEKKEKSSGKSLAEIYQEILSKKITSTEDVAHQSVGIYLRHERSLGNLIAAQTKERTTKTVVVYVYGATGVGKSRLSRLAARKISDKEAYYKSDGKWWDMYQNEQCVIWDDFRGKSYLFSETLKLLDRYPYKIEKKGGMIKFTSEYIFITSNVSPLSVYSVLSKEAFLRRIDFCIKLDSFDGTEIKGTDKDNENFGCNIDDFVTLLTDCRNYYKNE